MPSLWVAWVAYGVAYLVGSAGRRLGWLDRGGSLAAALVGGTIFAFAGWAGAALLIAFFVGGSLLSRLPANDRGANAGKGPRTARQVLANGAAAAGCAVWIAVAEASGSETAVHAATLAFAGALAALNADTWATEVGRFFGQQPRSAISFRLLEPGESGGVTTAGTFAGMMGAGVIGWLAVVVFPGFSANDAYALEAAGAIGMWCDSLLGASVQFKTWCSACGRVVEDRGHRHPRVDGASERPVGRRSGLSWIDNDVVNFATGLIGAGLAIYMGSLWK